MENVPHFVFGIFGNVTGLFLFFSPVLPEGIATLKRDRWTGQDVPGIRIRK